MGVKQMLLRCAAGEFGRALERLPDAFFGGVGEIRLRADKPVIVTKDGAEVFLGAGGPVVDVSESLRPSPALIAQCVEMISEHSLYAFEEELKNGYLSLPGGHRVGLAGKVVAGENGVKTIKNISGLNIRVSHEVKGCADGVMDFVASRGRVLHTMIISPPGCGKTTLLRDMIRQISDGAPGALPGQTVAVADERGEIAGCYMGVPQNDVGLRTDVLDACPKAEGVMMLLRSMSPRVIAVDEIGGPEDARAIEAVISGGVALLCTVHGGGIEDVLNKPALRGLLDKNIFERFIVLEGAGRVKAVYNEKCEDILAREGA